MPWFLVDDQFPTHDGVMAVSLAARGLWVTAGAWLSAHHKDVVPDHVLAALGSTPELVDELCTARLWKRGRGGYRFEQHGTCKIATQETVDKQREMKNERQRRWRENQSRRDVDSSTAPSTWYPGPDPGSNPVVDVVNRTNGSSGARDPTAVIDAIIKEIHDQTGKVITPDWASRIAAELVTPDVTNPAAYVRQCIRNDPDPRKRFLPLY